MSRLPWLLRTVAVAAGALHTAIAVQDQSMSEDGIAYLDLGDAYARGDWRPVNSVWSPVYPLLLGITIRLAGPSPRWEFTTVHLVNFAIYLLALLCFDFFWREIRRAVLQGEQETGAERLVLPDWAWWVFGYALFVWSSVVLIRFRTVSPDMLVAALVYLAAGLLVRIGRGEARPRVHAAFGAVLGGAYLSKAVMFPLAFAFLGAAALLRLGRAGWRRRWSLSVAAFAVMALPLVGLLSLEKGRFTFGEAGRLTYLRYINRMPYPHWPADAPAQLGRPRTPAHRILDHPPVYEFGSPIPGTYPLSLDPSYWYDGVAPRMQLGRQLRALAASARFYFDLFAREQGVPLGATLILLALSGEAWRRSRLLPGALPGWPLALIGLGLTALALYALVYVESRYVAPFLVLIWGGLLGLVRLRDSAPARAALWAAGIVLPLGIALEIVAFDSRYLPRLASMLRHGEISRTAPQPWELAEAVHAEGVRPGDRVGFIGYAFGATFARLARIRIVAELPSGQTKAFWTAPQATQDAVLAAFRQAGAAAVITDEPPPEVPENWIRLGSSNQYMYLLSRRAAPAPAATLLQARNDP